MEENKNLIPVNEDDNIKMEGALVITSDDGNQYIESMNGTKTISYCSVDQEKLSFKEKANFFNLISGDATPIKDCGVNTTIKLKDIYMEIVDVEDMVTKEPKKLPRQVLISDEGKAYTCSSPVFANKLAQLVQVAGHPFQWDEPIPIRFVKVKTKNGFEALSFVTAFK